MVTQTLSSNSEHNSIVNMNSTLQEGSPSLSDDEAVLSVARSHSLVDDMNDDSPVQHKLPQKRRRGSQISNDGWQSFRRKGTRFKAMLDDAFVRVVSSSSGEAEESATNSASTNESPITSDSYPSTVANIARQKTSECILLKQELEKVKSEQTQLRALNNELREAARQQSTRMQKMRNALQLASQNAAKARVEADTAEATAATLASQLQALQIVIEETKRASKVLLEEQNDVEQKAQSVEQKYIQTQAELARVNLQRKKLQRRNLELTENAVAAENQIRDLKLHLDHQKEETKHMEHSCVELESMEACRRQRVEQLEVELHQTQTLLVDATSTAAETESASNELKHAIEKVQLANQQLHKQLEEQQSQLRKERNDHQDAMQAVQQKVQSLKLETSNRQDQVRQLGSEKNAQEKRISQMQLKISNLERRLDESTNLVTTTPISDKTPSFAIPPLTGKENPLPGYKCSICFKDAVGLMKKCQCGKPDCAFRAHATCINKIKAGPSVSHPGTPAPRLPVILCSSNSAAITPLQGSAKK